MIGPSFSLSFCSALSFSSLIFAFFNEFSNIHTRAAFNSSDPSVKNSSSAS